MNMFLKQHEIIRTDTQINKFKSRKLHYHKISNISNSFESLFIYLITKINFVLHFWLIIL